MKVFISYTREDLAVAKKFHDDLKCRGIDCWMDLTGLDPAVIFEDVIKKQIANCDLFCTLISKHALERDCWEKREWEFALDRGKRVAPIRLEACSVPETLSSRQWVDLFPSYNDGLRRILVALKAEIRAASGAIFLETFSCLGADNPGWEFGEWQLVDDDHTGCCSQALRGRADLAIGLLPQTVTWTAAVTLDIGTAGRLEYVRRLDLLGANYSAEAAFRVIVDDGREHVLDEVRQQGWGQIADSGWVQRSVDLPRLQQGAVALRFAVSATDSMSYASHAHADIDDIKLLAAGPEAKAASG